MPKPRAPRWRIRRKRTGPAKVEPEIEAAYAQRVTDAEAMVARVKADTAEGTAPKRTAAEIIKELYP